jgi:uncharacterized protein (DUF58 family)
MPSVRGVVIAGVITALIAIAAVVPTAGLVALIADGLLGAGILLDRARAARRPLRATRHWPPLVVQGALDRVELAFEGVPGQILQAREASHAALSETPLRRELELGSEGRATWTYELRPRRRGACRVGPLTVRLRGPWGLAWTQRDVLPPQAVRVYPQVRWDGAVGRLLSLAQRRELGRAPLRVHGSGSEPYALRDYRSGDPPTRIHWKATARRGRLVTREDAWERGARLVILLDCGRAMASVDGRRSKLDHALAAALALARVAVARGDRVTIVAFSNRIERVVRAHGAAAAISRAYAELYDLEARLTESAFDVAAERLAAIETRQSTVLLLTSVVDLAATEVLREALVSLSRRHRPLLVNLEDAEIARLALGVPESAEEAFAKVASLEILLANRRLARRLGHAGIRVASAPADRVARQTLESYLGLVAIRSRATASLAAARGLG